MPTHPSQPRGRFRRPLSPRPIEPFDLSHPAAIDGLRILQIADLHVRRRPGPRSPIAELVDAVSRTHADLILLCGDYMHRPGHEDAALEILERLVDASHAKQGIFGVFGNHDTAELEERAAGLGIRWLLNESVDLGDLKLVGATFPEDFTGAVLGEGERKAEIKKRKGERGAAGGSGAGKGEAGERFGVAGHRSSRDLVLGLCHYPNELIAASELGIDILFAGHTHGGQWRLGKRMAPHTSCDLPWHLASGVLRYRNTLCIISRGLGEAMFEARINCPRHAPLITLRQGPIPGPVDARTDVVRQVVGW